MLNCLNKQTVIEALTNTCCDNYAYLESKLGFKFEFEMKFSLTIDILAFQHFSKNWSVYSLLRLTLVLMEGKGIKW